MRTNLTTVAAVAAGALLLANRRRHRHDALLDDDGLRLDAMDHGRPVGKTLVGLAALVAGGLYLQKNLRQGAGGLSYTEDSIEIDVPVRTAYDQWTQFEEFPKFMATVQEVRQVDDTHLHWRAVVAGKTKEWDAEITEQLPDERIAWRSTNGVRNGGTVTFDKLGENRTRVVLRMDYQPESVGEKLVDAVGGVKLTAKGNLKRFKQLLESRGSETGAWRGTVPQH